MNKKRILLLGDSILKGVMLDEHDKYRFTAESEWAKMESLFNVDITNISKMGSCSDRGLKVFSNYISTKNNFDTVVIEFGGNDSDREWQSVSADYLSRHRPKTEIKEFETNINRIIDLAAEYSVKPILMTLPPIDALRYFEWITAKGKLNRDNVLRYLDGDIFALYRAQEAYSSILKDIGNCRGIDVVDVRKSFLNHTFLSPLLCSDGIHPNVVGQNIIVEAFSHYSKNALKKESTVTP